MTLTTGATAPQLPRKEIHLQIPVYSHNTREHSGISPLIFRDSPDGGFVRPLKKMPFIHGEIKDTLSSVNASLGNASAKPRTGREVMNSSAAFHLLLRGKNFSIPENINRPSQDNLDNTFKDPHPPHLKDLHKGKGEENDTVLKEVYDHHFSEYLDIRANRSANDTKSDEFAEDLISSFNHKKNDTTMVLSSDMNAAIPDGLLLETRRENKSDSSETLLHNQAIQKNTNAQNRQKTINFEFPSSIVVPTREILKDKSVQISDAGYITESDNIRKLENRTAVSNNKERLHFMTTIASILPTQNPRNKQRNYGKQKGILTTSAFKTNNQTLNTNSRNPMLQDGSYQIATPESPFPEISWFKNDFEKAQNDGDISQKSDLFFKSSTLSMIVSPPLTTPDSHMNDPPFRGPNIPSEIDHFYKEEEKTKMDYHKPTIVETPSFVITYLGEDWKPNRQIWDITWDCHFYVTGSVFAVIAVYSFISLLRVNTFLTLLKPGYYIVINSIILLLCLLRTLYLFYDPYNLSGKYPNLAAVILLKITLPCLTSGFLLLQLSFLNSTKTQFFSPKVQSPCLLTVVILFVFTVYFSLEIAVSVFRAPFILTLFGYLLLIAWAMLSSISYFCVYRRLHHRAMRKQGEMIRLTFTKMHIDGAQLPKKLPKPTLGLSVKLVLLSAILQAILCILHGIALFKGFMPQFVQKEPWIWWGYQLTCRIVEVLIAATMSFIATQPQKHFEIGNNRFCSILMWFPCSTFAECFKKEELIDFEAHSDNYANPQGTRSTRFNLSANSRRLQTNSLPTFRTPLTEVDKNLPMRTLPCSGRHTNHASAISLLSYYR